MNRLDHFSFGARKLVDARGLLVDVLGGRPVDGGPGPGYTGGQWSYARGERLEVIVPDGTGNGFLDRFLNSRGPGVHHVTFVVPHLGAACDRAAAERFDVVGRNETFPWWKEAFLHPKQSLGIVVQLAESNPAEDAGAWSVDWEGFSEVGGEPSSPAAEIRTLVVAAPDPESARRLFGSTLGGREVDGANLTFEWDESPMRVAVEIAPGPPGPIRLEVSCSRRLDLGPAVLDSLGARVRQI